jgi:DNA mismatch endonuclease, patch repair protein
MTDVFSKDERSRIMSRIGGKNTKPELIVRMTLHRSGYRFRLHRRDLPGKPDIVLPRYRVAVFVHGCFWHGHDCKRGKRPATNQEFWNKKLQGNIRRDEINIIALQEQGWKVHVIWECDIKAGADILLALLRANSPCEPAT